jgi:3-hydroxyisobutyrate dehydrogenase
MLADDAASRGVYLSGDGVVAGARPETVFIECSTVSLGWIAELDAVARAAGCALIDAPVTGSKVQADSGQLLFLAGGDAAVLERVKPVLSTMARAILHLGPSGSGALMKLVNNFMCGVQAVALAEAVAFIERSQLDRQQALAVLLDGAPGSPLVKTLAPRMANRDYATNFALELMGKDLAYAMAEAARLNLELGTATAARAQFAKAREAGLERKDFSAVVEVLRDARAPERS